MESNDIEYIGFWKRVVAAITDSLFFSLICILLILALYGSEYIKFFGNLFLTIAIPFQRTISLPALLLSLATTKTSYNLLEQIIYSGLPALATVLFWITRSATPGLMAIPAKIISIRTGKKPSILVFIVRFIASTIFRYLLGVDYLWIVFSKKKQTLHDFVCGTAVVYCPNQIESGTWVKPAQKTLIKYFLVVVLALILNYSLESALFNPSVGPSPLFAGLTLDSAYHKISNSPGLEVFAICMIIVLFAIPPLTFRFSLRWLDEWWLASNAIVFGGALGNILERTLMGGVRNIFSTENRMVVWNPADTFLGIGILSLAMILLVSRLWLISKSFRQDDYIKQ